MKKAMFVIIMVLVLFIVIAAALLVVTFRRAVGGSIAEQSVSEGGVETGGSPTNTTGVAETPVESTQINVCELGKIEVYAIASLRTAYAQDYSYQISITVSLRNNYRDMNVKVLKIIIDNSSFIKQLVDKLVSEGFDDYVEDIRTSMVKVYEDLVIKPGGFREERFSFPIPDPIVEYWSEGTRHTVTIEYMVNGEKCPLVTVEFIVQGG